jgi:hypothetical protein
MRGEGASGEGASPIWETVVLQRREAREQRDRYLAIIARLVGLEDAPRSIHYDRVSRFAWEAARDVVHASCPIGQAPASIDSASARQLG